jgi:hypothetical protein
MATKVKENEEAEAEREGAPDGPLLDLSDAAVKRMIKVAKKRGFVTYEELNSVLPSEPTDRTDDPVRMYLREMGSVELAVPRGRNRHRQAHRGRPRGDDRGPLREPADLPGHHHLARRAQRRQGPAARHHRSRSDLCRPRRQERPNVGRPAKREERARRKAAAPRREVPEGELPSDMTSTTTTSRTTCRSRPWRPS